MTSENDFKQLVDVCEFIGRGITPVYVDVDGIPVINQKCIRNGNVDLKQARRTDPQKKRITKEKFLKEFDILVNSTGVGTLGRVGQIFKIDGELTVDTHVTIVRPNINEIDPTYLGYVIKSLQSKIEELAEGSTGQTELSRHKLGALVFRTLDRFEQSAIGQICKNIDDRIAILHETNATLEAIAQALFKSWFVDFDPVRAKSEGKLPEGMDEATAALFPDAFEENELGLVPKGWSATTLSTVASFQNGYAFKGSDWSAAGHPVVKIGNVKPLHIDFDDCSYVSPQTVVGLERFKLGAGDLLVGMTGYVGETGLVPHNDTASYLNQRVGRITTNNGLQDLGFVFSAVRQKEFKIYAESQSHGSAQANVSGADLMKFTVTVPSAEIFEKYNELTYQFIASILNNHSKATLLTSLRDTLLPRLISGQLRIADAEAEIEKVSV